jgi:DNA (cytosine-5)-methyltransferase 1
MVMKVAGLFAGIGGIERGFGAGFETALLCEKDDRATHVLERRFADVTIHPDITTLGSLPNHVDVVTAGFPCTDLSQAGRTAGLSGSQSGLVEHVFRLLKKMRRGPTWLVIENVRNMLVLDKGHAMSYLVDELDELGYRWAYRVVDTRAFGLPQRRQRVLLVASPREDPCGVLFADEAGEPPSSRYADDAYGFYWTEGLRGLGWAQDATPTLKGGSSVGIPSPPGVWVPGAPEGRRLVVPSIEDAERLQGFPRAWTDGSRHGTRLRAGYRWKLVGNAVSVPVARWLGSRLRHPGKPDPSAFGSHVDGRWPLAAWGDRGERFGVVSSMWPKHLRYQHLTKIVDVTSAAPLSHQAAAGFYSRLERSTLRVQEEFRLDVKRHVEFTA